MEVAVIKYGKYVTNTSTLTSRFSRKRNNVLQRQRPTSHPDVFILPGSWLHWELILWDIYERPRIRSCGRSYKRCARTAGWLTPLTYPRRKGVRHLESQHLNCVGMRDSPKENLISNQKTTSGSHLDLDNRRSCNTSNRDKHFRLFTRKTFSPQRGRNWS